MMKILAGLTLALVAFATRSPARAASEAVVLYWDVSAEVCQAPGQCSVADGMQRPIAFLLTGPNDSLKDEKTIPVSLDGVTARAKITIEKSGGLYFLKVVISDSVLNRSKGDFRVYLRQISDLHPFSLSGYAVQPRQGRSAMTVDYMFMFSPTMND